MASRCQCSYKYPGDSWDPFVPGPERKCAERPWDGSDKGLCVYHSPQNITSREATQIVWNEALKRCSEGHTSCDFTGWHFPANDDGFKDKTLVNACFAAAVFVGEISFEGTIFKGETRFNSAEFQSDACFRKSRFEQICFFMRTHFSALANFENVDFALLRFDGAVFDNLAIFWEAEFPQLACFAGVKFAEAHFSGITFQQNAEYNAAHFINKGNFDSVEFEKDVYFDEARFDSGADFSKSSFHKKADFSGVKTGSGSLLNLDSGPADNGACTFEIIKEGESAYRAAKQAAANAGNYLGASKYHYAEQVAITWKIRQSGKWGFLVVGFSDMEKSLNARFWQDCS